MPQIIPIKDLEDTANVSELCHTLNEPIYITKNSYGDMVLMSMDYYENTRKSSSFTVLPDQNHIGCFRRHA